MASAVSTPIVDGSTQSLRAARFGFDIAARHRHDVVAVHAWSDLPIEALGRPTDVDREQARHDATARLNAHLAAHRRRYPQVPVHPVIAIDRPAHTLLDHAPGATLLIVGRHGREQATPAPLGSVTHAVLHYAPCPVAVIGPR